jgi:chromatin modification-related protein VID21
MSEVGPADRSRLLRSKKNELRYINPSICIIQMRMIRRIDAYNLSHANRGSGIVTSRKRKLREFFAVCDNDGPIPQIKYSHPDAPATSIAENRFLEVTDILKYVQHAFPSQYVLMASCMDVHPLLRLTGVF